MQYILLVWTAVALSGTKTTDAISKRSIQRERLQQKRSIRFSVTPIGSKGRRTSGQYRHTVPS